VISIAPESLNSFKELVDACPFEMIGTVGGDNLSVTVSNKSFSTKVSDLESAWRDSLASKLEN